MFLFFGGGDFEFVSIRQLLLQKSSILTAEGVPWSPLNSHSVKMI